MFSVSLNEVRARAGFVGALGGDVCGVSEVVAKVRSAVFGRGRALNVEAARRQRDRGSEAAIVVLCVYTMEEKSRSCVIMVESILKMSGAIIRI